MSRVLLILGFVAATVTGGYAAGPGSVPFPRFSSRAATGSDPVTVSARDYVILLNGPTQVNLEAAPPNGTTHLLKDRGSISGAGTVTVIPGGSDLIDGAGSYQLTRSGQAVFLYYTTGYGWSLY